MSTILFLCTGNSCRSQMAEGWGRALLGSKYQFVSAGTKKQTLNPYAEQVMREAGVDISEQFSKTVDELANTTIDVAISVCSEAEKSCPYFPAKTRVHQPFDDPPKITQEMTSEEEKLQVYRRVRDEIKVYVMGLEKTMEANSVS